MQRRHLVDFQSEDEYQKLKNNWRVKEFLLRKHLIDGKYYKWLQPMSIFANYGLQQII